MFKKNNVKQIVTHESRTQDARGKVIQALEVFQRAKQEVVTANEALKDIGTDVDAEIAYLTELRKNINIHSKQHEALIEKFNGLTV